MNEFDDPVARLHRAASAASAPELDPAIVTGAPDRRAPRLVRHGRAARGAGIGLVAVAAVSVGALVVGNPFAAPAPLFAAAGAGGAEAASFATDSRLALWANYEYLAGAGLSTEGGRGGVYELRRAGDPESVLRDAAAALGLDGASRAGSYSTPEYPSYVVGPEDGSAPSLTLSWAGTGDWWYNDPAAYPQQVCEEVPIVAEDGTATSFSDCRQPEIPASASLAPSADEARQLAATLFAATGFEVSADAIEVTADAWQTTATASLVVDGQATALQWSVAWTPLGKIAWASGHSIEVVARGEYDTVSAAAAVERLSDGRWFGAAGPAYSGGGMVAFAADSGLARSASGELGTAEPPVQPGDEVDPGVVPIDPGVVPIDPGVVPVDPGVVPVDPDVIEPEPLPTPETVTVTFEHAEATLVLLWDVDGNAWLVPGYAFENPEQGFWSVVVSIVEGVITLPDPVEIEPLPAVLDK
ncbi:hypothetical protein [Protaetiibacter larvae]|uniref:Uncharacterized protein n=1 Tax=Protaetiibacter larvae TaxID=2592654 RepID=A0A5C1YBS0_9MICO|nr:hypothetical protein [Protaetiibacter larvae]QEO10332.1 hypothetical protein FLP23_10125 [Protaetiibacter larvae]